MSSSTFIEYKIYSKDNLLLFTIFCNCNQNSIMIYIKDFQTELNITLKRMDFVEYINSIGKHRAYDSIQELLRCEQDVSFKMTKRRSYYKNPA